MDGRGWVLVDRRVEKLAGVGRPERFWKPFRSISEKEIVFDRKSPTASATFGIFWG